jgi:hypothetical protein
MIPTLIVIKGRFTSPRSQVKVDFESLRENTNITFIKSSRIDYYYKSNIVSLTKYGTFTVYLCHDIGDIILSQELIFRHLHETFLQSLTGGVCSYNIVNIHFKGNLAKPRAVLKVHIEKYVDHPKLKCYCRDSECSVLLPVTKANYDTAFAHTQYLHFVCEEGTLRLKFSGHFSIICKGTKHIDFWIDFARHFEEI